MSVDIRGGAISEQERGGDGRAYTIIHTEE
jgi:hypothetical protein